jgi:hypothetical protein
VTGAVREAPQRRTGDAPMGCQVLGEISFGLVPGCWSAWTRPGSTGVGGMSSVRLMARGLHGDGCVLE